MVVFCFFKIIGDEVNVMEENLILKSRKDVVKFGGIFFIGEILVFDKIK